MKSSRSLFSRITTRPSHNHLKSVYSNHAQSVYSSSIITCSVHTAIRFLIIIFSVDGFQKDCLRTLHLYTSIHSENSPQSIIIIIIIIYALKIHSTARKKKRLYILLVYMSWIFWRRSLAHIKITAEYTKETTLHIKITRSYKKKNYFYSLVNRKKKAKIRIPPRSSTKCM